MIRSRENAVARREQIRKEFWSEEDLWGVEKEQGWSRIPRTISLLLTLLDYKELSGRENVSRVYLELYARHMDNGIVEITNEVEFTFACGYSPDRGLRS